MTNIKTNVYQSDSGMVLVNKENPMSQGHTIYLCPADSIDNWVEITQEEADKAFEDALNAQAIEEQKEEAVNTEENPEN